MTLDTETSRARYWRDTERRRKVWVNRETEKARKRFEEEGAYILSLFLHAGTAAALLGVTAQTPFWNAYLTSLYLVVGSDFAKRFFESVLPPAAATSGGEVDRGQGDLQREDHLHSALLAWLFGEGVRRAREITNTSRERLAATLAEGMAAGETTPQLAQRITQEYSQWSAGRAKTIARTEVVSASNLGMQEAARTTISTIGLVLNKVWVAVPDARTRPWHRAASGQQQGLNAYFLVGGEQLLYPGDASHGASAENLVNCRCAVGYQVASAAQRIAA